jgi:oligo-1,6-glucosidase
MTNAGFISITDYRDIESLNYYAEQVAAGVDPNEILEALRVRSRDNARTPMQWSGDPNAGFSTGTPWIGVNPNFPAVNVQRDRSAPRSIFAHYQRLIALRHELPVVSLGGFELLEPEHPTLFAFARTMGAERLLVLANFSGEPLATPLAEGKSPADLLIGNYPSPDAEVADVADAAELRPWEVRVYGGASGA